MLRTCLKASVDLKCGIQWDRVSVNVENMSGIVNYSSLGQQI